MSTTVNNLLKNILCLLIAVLLSLTELQFFDGGKVFSFVFLLILSVTIPIIYLYFLPKQDTVIIFIYNIVLVFILDLLGKNVDIKLFLISLFCVLLLLCQSTFTENAKKFNSKNAAYRVYCFILIIFLTAIVLLSFLIYEYILKPNIHDKFELSLMYENSITEDIVNINQNYFENNTDKNGGGGGGSGGLPKINVLLICILIFVFTACLICVYLLYRLIRYKVWLNKTIKVPNNDRICRLYRYILNSLSVCGIQRKPSETPFEYIESSNNDSFPFSKTEFQFLTNTFVAAYYGSEEVSTEDCDRCLMFFYSLSNCLRERLGIKGYFFRYLLKFKWRTL